MNIATVLAVFVSLFFTASGGRASAENPQNSPIQIIVPYSPGAVADSLVRIIAPELRKCLRRPVLVVSRPAGGVVAASQAFARAPADGSQFLLVTAAHVLPSISTLQSSDPLREFVPVATIASNEFVLVGSLALPANNLSELIALAVEKPDRLSFGSAGEFSASHLAGALFNALAGVSIQHVPYKGAAPALVDLLGGHLDLSFQGPLAVLGPYREGRLKALGYAGDHRSAVLPDVPTFAEGGVDGFNLKIWFGLLAPPGTPQEIVDRMSSAIARSLAKPAVERQITEQGMTPLVNDSRQFSALLEADRDKFDALFRSTGINLGK